MIVCQLNRVYYPVTTLGYGKRLGVWFQGCPRRCEGCISPEMQPVLNHSIPIEQVLCAIPDTICPDGLTISGGEPFEQPAALRALVEWFLERYGDDILIYTGYLMDELVFMHNEDVTWILAHIAALIDGPYIQPQDDGKGARGSANQRIHVFRYTDRYRHYAVQPRKLQCIYEHGQLFLVGIPPNRRDERNG